MTAIHHSHVWAELLHTAGRAGDVHPADFQVLAWSDTAALGATPTFSLTIPGRTAVAGGARVPWSELIAQGDVLRVAAHSTAHADATPRVVSDGLVVDVLPSEVRTKDGYQYTTTYQCEGFQHVLMNDQVAWWMFYGSAEGWARARGELLPDDLSGRLDKVIANYLSRIAFNKSAWQRGGLSLGARVGYHLRTLTPLVPPQINISVAEGTHWSIMQSSLDDLHEFYTCVQPADFNPQGGYAHRPNVREPVILSSAPDLTHDDGRTWVMVRPRPFPFAEVGGAGNLGEWARVPLHDFTDVMEPIEGAALASSLRDVRNFFLMVPTVQLLNSEVAFTAGVAVQNRDAIGRYSYRPYKTSTNLLIDDTHRADFVDLARQFSWRLAGQWNRMDEMGSTTLTLPLAPHIQVGDRVRFRAPLGDETQVVEGYVQGRTHSWNSEQGGTTSVSVTRALPVGAYRDPSWFAKGLSAVEVNIRATAPQHRPG